MNWRESRTGSQRGNGKQKEDQRGLEGSTWTGILWNNCLTFRQNYFGSSTESALQEFKGKSWELGNYSNQ